ncbi:MAG: peptide chain release factor N(5)-glutamine methyltransferase [Chloroflexota bacterium]|nr:peptide chain release factor N(5)-glutamine methyltransferase [Chloroflexota bacterium]
MTSVSDALGEGVERLRAAGSGSARLDAELLLAHAVGADRTTILAHPEAAVGPGQQEVYERALERRAAGEPVAYIRGVKEFYGLAFSVDPRALIPRPETERLVELALGRIVELLTDRPRPAGTPRVRVLDVGTGSGAVAVTLAVVLRRRGLAEAVTLAASDRSAEALSLALENAVAHGVSDMVEFRMADLLDDDLLAAGPFELVTGNLPYIPTSVLRQLPAAAGFEPRDALDGGPDGLSLVRRLLGRLPMALAGRGAALLEIGSDQAEAVRDAAARALPGWILTIHPDLAGDPRVAELRQPSA